MPPSMRVGGDRDQMTFPLQHPLRFSHQPERIVHMLDYVAHHHGVKFSVAKSGLIETPAENGDSEGSTGSIRCIFVHLLTLNVPSSSPQLGKALPVAAADLEDPPSRLAA